MRKSRTPRVSTSTKEKFYFCEPVWATSTSRWHIRPTGPKGKMLGGGADTLALCGMVVAWDTNPRVDAETVTRLVGDLCSGCVTAWWGGYHESSG